MDFIRYNKSTEGLTTPYYNENNYNNNVVSDYNFPTILLWGHQFRANQASNIFGDLKDVESIFTKTYTLSPFTKIDTEVDKNKDKSFSLLTLRDIHNDGEELSSFGHYDNYFFIENLKSDKGKITINNNGNVGIGDITSPVEKLQVDGNVKADKFKGDIEANNATINNLNATNATINNLQADQGNIQDLIIKTIKTQGFEKALNGFGVWIDDNGRAHGQIDFLEVIGKAIFHELEIRKLSAVGGDIALSPASSRIEKVEKVINGWKCYLMTDDGTMRTQNGWRVGDQAKCQTFNIKEGVYHNVSNRYYWRVVTEVAEKTADDEAYIILSNVDGEFDPMGTDAPMKGDTIVLCGHNDRYDKAHNIPTDEGRMSFTILRTSLASGPTIELYRRIYDFSMTNRNIVFKLSPDKITIRSKSIEYITDDGTTVPTLLYMGDWKEGTVANNYEVYFYNGTSFLSLVDNNRNKPSKDSSKWKVFSSDSKGQKGDKGEDGNDGKDGNDSISLNISPTTLVFDTNDNGIVSQQSLDDNKCKVTMNIGGVENEVSISNISSYGCSARHIGNGVIKVTSVNQVNGKSVGSGYFTFNAYCQGHTLSGKVYFGVNVSTVVAKIESDNKHWKRTIDSKLEKYDGSIIQNTTTINQLKDEINLKAEKNEVDALNKKVTKNEGNITILSDKVSNTVTKDVYNKKTQEIEKQIGDISVKSNRIDLTVTSNYNRTKNLLSQTMCGCVSNIYGCCNKYNITTKLEKGKTYTLSAEMMLSPKLKDDNVSAKMYIFNGGWSWSVSKSFTNTKLEQCSITFKLPDSEDGQELFVDIYTTWDKPAEGKIFSEYSKDFANKYLGAIYIKSLWLNEGEATPFTKESDIKWKPSIININPYKNGNGTYNNKQSEVYIPGDIIKTDTTLKAVTNQHRKNVWVFKYYHKSNTDYTLSFKVNGKGKARIFDYCEDQERLNSGKWISQGGITSDGEIVVNYFDRRFYFTNEGDWTKRSLSITQREAGFQKCFVIQILDGELTFKDIKVEEQGFATPILKPIANDDLRGELERVGIHLDGEKSEITAKTDKFKVINTRGEITAQVDKTGKLDINSAQIGKFLLDGGKLVAANYNDKTKIREKSVIKPDEIVYGSDIEVNAFDDDGIPVKNERKFSIGFINNKDKYNRYVGETISNIKNHTYSYFNPDDGSLNRTWVNIGLRLDVKGARTEVEADFAHSNSYLKYGNHALYIDNGDICGIRYNVKYITNTTYTLDKTDTLIVNVCTKGEGLWWLPADPEDGQSFRIIPQTANANAREIIVRCQQNHKFQNGEKEHRFRGTTLHELVFVSDTWYFNWYNQ